MNGVRKFAFGVICLTVAACDFGSIGDAKTGAELAPSLEPLRDLAPEHYRRLADGTFDSLSLMEQRTFVDEIEELVRQRREARRAESAAAVRQSIIEFQESIETLQPDVAERYLAAWRKNLLISLKSVDVSLRRRAADRPEPASGPGMIERGRRTSHVAGAVAAR